MKKLMLLAVLLIGMVLVQGCRDEEKIAKQAEENRIALIKAADLKLKGEKALAAHKVKIAQEEAIQRTIADAKARRVAEERNRSTCDVYASGISKEYDDNEARADAKYGGRRVTVRGKITDISLSWLGSGGYVVLEGHEWLSGVHCRFKDSSALTRFNKGQNVSICGTVHKGGTTLGSVTLLNCQ